MKEATGGGGRSLDIIFSVNEVDQIVDLVKSAARVPFCCGAVHFDWTRHFTCKRPAYSLHQTFYCATDRTGPL
jgi:hypothetical protein